MKAKEREHGYYWVKFPYLKWGINKLEHWEVGSWDSGVRMWALIGSKDMWFEEQLSEIGERIKEPI